MLKKILILATTIFALFAFQPAFASMTADKPAKPAKTSAESTKPPQQKN
jgi:hypothetical protein